MKHSNTKPYIHDIDAEPWHLCLYLASDYDNMKQNIVVSRVLEEILVLKYLD